MLLCNSNFKKNYNMKKLIFVLCMALYFISCSKKDESFPTASLVGEYTVSQNCNFGNFDICFSVKENPSVKNGIVIYKGPCPATVSGEPIYAVLISDSKLNIPLQHFSYKYAGPTPSDFTGTGTYSSSQIILTTKEVLNGNTSTCTWTATKK